MLDLFALPAVMIDVAMEPEQRNGAVYRLRSPGGSVVARASMSQISVEGELRRWFGNAATYPFTITLRDAPGAAVLLLRKRREHLLRHGYQRIDVELADGSRVGRAERAGVLSGSVGFADKDGVTVARAEVGQWSAGFSVHAEAADGAGGGAGAEWAQVRVGPVNALGAAESLRSFEITFTADAPLLVRALVVGYVIGADAQQFPKGPAL